MSLTVAISIIVPSISLLGFLVGIAIQLGRILERMDYNEKKQKELKEVTERDLTGMSMRFQHEKEMAMIQHDKDIKELEKKWEEHRDQNEKQHDAFNDYKSDSRDEITRLATEMKNVKDSVDKMMNTLDAFIKEMRSK